MKITYISTSLIQMTEIETSITNYQNQIQYGES